MIIRDALEADLPAIVAIYNEAIRGRISTAQLDPVSVEERLPWFHEHTPTSHPLWVAECEGQIAGWLSFHSFMTRCAYHGTAEISVYVDENFRGTGVGRAMLKKAIADSPSLAISSLVGCIFAHNEPSLRLFEQLGFTRWGLLPRVARVDGVERDLTIMGRHCGARPAHDEGGLPHPEISASDEGLRDDCFALMHALMLYRQEPIHARLSELRHKHSMLHLDVLLLIYHFAKICTGHVLEIGAFVGGATIAAAFGIRDSGTRKALITIEPGGSVRHEHLGTKNILRDFERNIARQRLTEMVTLIKGHSFDPATTVKVRQTLAADSIGLLILDADGHVQRDIECYGDRLATGCWIVIDDYHGPAPNTKVASTRAEIDALVKSGSLVPLGFYGWGTWVGRWRCVQASS